MSELDIQGKEGRAELTRKDIKVLTPLPQDSTENTTAGPGDGVEQESGIQGKEEQERKGGTDKEEEQKDENNRVEVKRVESGAEAVIHHTQCCAGIGASSVCSIV